VIVVPLDGSEFSARAIPVGVRLATRLATELLLLSAIEQQDERNEREEWLAAVVPRGDVLSRVVVDADPAAAIQQALDRPGAIGCMASHGRGRSAALLGSVALDVIARGHDSLVLVGPQVDVETGGERVVACIDETPRSQSLLAKAAHIAGLLDEPLDVVTVAEPVPPPISGRQPQRRFGPDEDVDAYLETAVAPLREAGRPVATHAIYDPISPAAGIRDFVFARPAAVVAVSSHARTGAKRFLLGSVAADIVRSINSPALVVSGPDDG
jgi:nucleotide-binding universal stress UspA family protein